MPWDCHACDDRHEDRHAFCPTTSMRRPSSPIDLGKPGVLWGPDATPTALCIVVDTDELPRSTIRKPGQRARAGGPALPRKNRYWGHQVVGFGRDARPQPFRTAEAMAFIEVLYRRAVGLELVVTPTDESIRRRVGLVDDVLAPPPIRQGWWRLELLQLAGRASPKDVLLPDLDSDACLHPVRDALQYIGLVDDDKRIISNDSTAVLRRGRPGLVIRLRLIDEPQQAVARVWPGFLAYG